jgi:hypothetical protein
VEFPPSRTSADANLDVNDKSRNKLRGVDFFPQCGSSTRACGHRSPKSYAIKSDTKKMMMYTNMKGNSKAIITRHHIEPNSGDNINISLSQLQG